MKLLHVRAAILNDPQPARVCKSVLWFMGIRASLDDGYENLKVALLTAKAHAPSLVPCLIWSGAASPVTGWFERQGGRVFFHDLTFHAELPMELDSEAGAYLRLDVPLILNAMKPLAADVEAEHVLYTDPDVIFLNDIDGCSLPKPKVLAMGTQGFLGSQARASPGVMFMNTSALAEHRDRLLDFGRARKYASGSAQALTKAYFRPSQIAQLPMRFNWKPYWGGGDASTTIALVHFYGPKPGGGLQCLLQDRVNKGKACGSIPSLYRELFASAPDGGAFYNVMLQHWEMYAHQARQP